MAFVEAFGAVVLVVDEDFDFADTPTFFEVLLDAGEAVVLALLALFVVPETLLAALDFVAAGFLVDDALALVFETAAVEI